MSQEAATRLDKRMLIDGEWVEGDGRTDAPSINIRWSRRVAAPWLILA